MVQAISQMGDKLASKMLSNEAGVSGIPGYDGVITVSDDCMFWEDDDDDIND